MSQPKAKKQRMSKGKAPQSVAVSSGAEPVTVSIEPFGGDGVWSYGDEARGGADETYTRTRSVRDLLCWRDGQHRGVVPRGASR